MKKMIFLLFLSGYAQLGYGWGNWITEFDNQTNKTIHLRSTSPAPNTNSVAGEIRETREFSIKPNSRVKAEFFIIPWKNPGWGKSPEMLIATDDGEWHMSENSYGDKHWFVIDKLYPTNYPKTYNAIIGEGTINVPVNGETKAYSPVEGAIGSNGEWKLIFVDNPTGETGYLPIFKRTK